MFFIESRTWKNTARAISLFERNSMETFSIRLLFCATKCDKHHANRFRKQRKVKVSFYALTNFIGDSICNQINQLMIFFFS